MQIHTDFKLFSKSFRQSDDLIHFLKVDYPTDAQFLKELFNPKNYIIVQTSGSTGIPKKIKIKKQALIKSAENTGKYFNLAARSKVLHCLPSTFIAGKMMWVRALHLGWHVTLVKPNANPLENIEECFDFAAMVPLQAQNAFEKLYQIKHLILGGAPLDPIWEEKLAQLPTMAYLTYGMTETITHIAVRKIGEKKVFHCLPDISVSVDDRSCLMIKAPYISAEPIITNDIVLLHSDISFEWKGRFDYVINSGGIKFSPEMIEEKLVKNLSHPFVISSKKDPILGEKIVLVIAAPPYAIDKEMLFENSDLTPYERPKEILFIDNLPITENGKISRVDIKSHLNR